MNNQTNTSPATADFSVENHGSIYLFRPLTPEARRYLVEEVESEGWQWMGTALCVDHRQAQGLAEHLQEAGFQLQ